jgi:hypothetical protein
MGISTETSIAWPCVYTVYSLDHLLLSDTISLQTARLVASIYHCPRRNSNSQLFGPRRHPRAQHTQTPSCWAQGLHRDPPDSNQWPKCGPGNRTPRSSRSSMTFSNVVAVMGSCCVIPRNRSGWKQVRVALVMTFTVQGISSEVPCLSTILNPIES